MAKARVVHVREETPDEAATDRWFAKQALASPDTVDSAARLIVSLVTGLLTVLFGVLAVAGDPLPAYLGHGAIRALGVLSVLALLGGLLFSLAVVMPRRVEADASRPASQAKAFGELLEKKVGWLRVAVIAFGLGVVFLGGALIGALIAV